MATPLVVSVHSIVSMDFAIAQVPGWHQTFFPPYFVVGAIYSGFALVLMLLVPIRKIFGWQHIITERHLETNAKVLLVTGWLLLYAYVIEFFLGWYSGNVYERYLALVQRPFGPYAVAYWALLFLNFVPIQALWFRRVRRSALACFLVSVCVFVAMWLERFVIIVASLERDFLPSSWHLYKPTWVDLGLISLSIVTFFFLFLLFIKWAPAIPISEVKEIAHARRQAEARHEERSVASWPGSARSSSACPAPTGSAWSPSSVIPDALLDAVRALREDGVARMDAYVPYPVEGLEEALGARARAHRLVIGIAAFGGAALAYLLLWWINVVDFPRNVGGRPLHSAPAFIPITFETGILFGGTTAFCGPLHVRRDATALAPRLRGGGIRERLGGRLLGRRGPERPALQRGHAARAPRRARSEPGLGAGGGGSERTGG